MGRKRQGCAVCFSVEAPRGLGHRICDGCRQAKKDAKKVKYYVPVPKVAQDAKQKEEARAKQRAEDQMLRSFYKLAGLNAKGEEVKQGWTNSLVGLTPLKQNPFLDPDYEFDAPERLTMRELKELL